MFDWVWDQRRAGGPITLPRSKVLAYIGPHCQIRKCWMVSCPSVSQAAANNGIALWDVEAIR